MAGHDKLESLSLASFFLIVSYLQVRPEHTEVVHIIVPNSMYRIIALHNIKLWKKKLAKDKQPSLFCPAISDKEKKVV